MSVWIKRDPARDAPPYLPGNPVIEVKTDYEGFGMDCIVNSDEIEAYWEEIVAYRIVDQDMVSSTLKEREARYGEFIGHADISQHLKEVIFEGKDRHLFKSSDQVEALEMICHKIARIVNGDENYADSWIDIAGYATLVAERLTKGE